MFATCHYLQIAWRIVVFVSINVMYMLITKKRTSNHRFCNNPMLMTP